MGGICFGMYHFVFKVWLNTYTNHNQEIEIPDLSAMNIQQAIKALDDLKLTYEIDSAKFDSTHSPYAILDFYPVKGFMVKQGRKILIKANPKTWRPVPLPDIIGKSKRLAFTQLKLSGLEVGDTIYEPDLAKDAVLRIMFQGKDIPKGTELPRFAKVDVVLGKGLEYGVAMQNVTGMSLEQARSSIIANRFEVGQVNIDSMVMDSTLLRVYYQYPLPGDNYDQGLPVDLWLSAKESDKLNDLIRELDRQYRNFGANDSIAAKKYAEDLNVNQRAIETPQEQRTVVTPSQTLPDEVPEGIEFVE